MLRRDPLSPTGTLQADACGPGYRYDSHTRLQLESKEDMRRRNARSPDEWDAARTFAKRCSRELEVKTGLRST